MKNIMLLLFLLINVLSFSQNVENFQTKQVAESKKFINYIFIKNKQGNLIPYGTGFFVLKQIDSNRYIIFLATAKHVLRDSINNYFNQIFVRFNLKNGEAMISQLNLFLGGEEKNVFFHSDSTVDIALIPLKGDFSKIDFVALSVDNMLTRNDFLKNGIAEGTEVFFTGLFTRCIGIKKNYPISRFGKIALIPEERIDFVDSKKDLILLETTSYGGNSGSPVFVSYESGNFKIRKLIGIMTGSFEEFNELSILTNPIPISKENTGISAITPSNYLMELLNSEVFK